MDGPLYPQVCLVGKLFDETRDPESVGSLRRRRGGNTIQSLDEIIQHQRKRIDGTHSCRQDGVITDAHPAGTVANECAGPALWADTSRFNPTA
jgi:succinate dehydrogenase/fumarate reductase-like Fe-S protein